MPLITRRSSTRALPRVSVGRCGLIFENCAFVSQNWSRLIYASFSEAVNHATTFVPTLLWVRTLAPCVQAESCDRVRRNSWPRSFGKASPPEAATSFESDEPRKISTSGNNPAVARIYSDRGSAGAPSGCSEECHGGKSAKPRPQSREQQVEPI